LANLAIGQGELLTTPLQMAQFAMILATKGVVKTPHIAAYLYDSQDGKRIEFPPKTSYVQGISDEVYDLIRQGMLDVVNGGTGWRGSVYGIQVAGKTGTAQNPHGDDHAWFISFAPYENPVIALAVIVENAGGGGAVAAPLASMCMERFFYDRLLPRHTVSKDTLEVDSLENMIRLKINNIPSIEVLSNDSS
jgi:penicillin-binding protein 2